MNYTLTEAKEYTVKGKALEWNIKLLEKTNNKKFAEHIKNHNGRLQGPIKIRLDRLIRCCGPESDMKFQEEKEIWDKRISKMVAAIKKGWDVPPLLVWHLNEELSIADGVHRFEALKKAGYKEYEVFIWSDSET